MEHFQSPQPAQAILPGEPASRRLTFLDRDSHHSYVLHRSDYSSHCVLEAASAPALKAIFRGWADGTGGPPFLVLCVPRDTERVPFALIEGRPQVFLRIDHGGKEAGGINQQIPWHLRCRGSPGGWIPALAKGFPSAPSRQQGLPKPAAGLAKDCVRRWRTQGRYRYE